MVSAMSPWIGPLTVALAAQLAARPVPPAALPPPMIGIWGWRPASCANPNDDGRVVVEPASVTFYVATYDLRSIRTKPDRTIEATALVREEGLEDDKQDKAEHTIRLKLIAPNRLWIDVSTHTYRRCKR